MPATPNVVAVRSKTIVVANLRIN
jgi:hypothetical protein